LEGIVIFSKKSKTLYLLLLTSVILNASTYDDDILNIFSKIAPRFIMMSTQKSKIKSEIEICVLYDKIDERIAMSFVDKINTNYPNGIKNYPIKFINKSYADLNECKTAQLAFIFNSDKKNIEDAVVFLNKQNILSMSYEQEFLEYGVQISLFIGRKVLPYINIKAISDNKIELENILLRVSKIYEESN
jgi:hypothetical protein